MKIASLMLSFFSPVKFQTIIGSTPIFSRFFLGKNSPAPVGGLQGKGLQAEALAGHGDHLQGRQLRLFRLRFGWRRNAGKMSQGDMLTV